MVATYAWLAVRYAKNVSSPTCAAGRARHWCKSIGKRRRERVMEGSVGSGKKKSDPGELSSVFANAGLSPKAAAAWGKLLRFSGKYKRDAAEASKFWSDGASFLARLPKKPQRNDAQKLAAEII